MEDKPAKRQYRKRTPVPRPDDVVQGASQPNADDGVGAFGSGGTEIQEVASREVEGVSWHELVAMVHSLNSWDRRIACVVHPEAVGIVESDRFGGIRTEVGPAGYVLSTGERIKLEG